jgi:hypothetical protein
MKLPRFTLRDLFWLTLVAGMAVALWIEHERASAWQEYAEELHNRQVWGDLMTQGLASEAQSNSRRALERARTEQPANESADKEH